MKGNIDLFSNVLSSTVSGIDALLVQIETDISSGIPSFEMMGTLGSEVKEARDRILVALKNSGVGIKPSRVVVNISPANVRKEGTGFDLPIAVGILIAGGYVNSDFTDNTIFVGELSLDGRVNAINGVLSCACLAKKSGIGKIVVPISNFEEARLACNSKELTVYGVSTLKEVIRILEGDLEDIPHSDTIPEDTSLITNHKKDYLDIRGQYAAKRATMIAVAGMHNLMYIGPPGSGKTMLAERIPTIMPEMSYDEKLEVTKVASVAGVLDEKGIINQRPFRHPHHNITMAGLLGGGRIPKPGEITLSAKGVLFLDEMTEFKSECIESLRQPLEDKSVIISRHSAICTFPTDFMLVGAINPCKCGYYPDRNKCTCQESDIRRYFGRISNPMWDRFDICVIVDGLTGKELIDKEMINQTKADKTEVNCGGAGKYDTCDNLNSKEMRKIIEKARLVQKERFEGTGIRHNSEISANDIDRYCVLGDKERAFMKKAFNKLGLTARGYSKILKTARTIADIEGNDNITCEHLMEACMYKNNRR
ncbi:MAG: YifB family Mg chelatase-like AAA ATPase [Lachnospira sp.]